jgi:hypothetical protein
MRIAVIGPGAVGGTVAAWLAQAHDVQLCARTPLTALHVETPDGPIAARPSVVTDPTDATPADWVIVATKTYDAEATARWFPALLGADTRVAVFQNGVEHVARFAPWIDAARIVPAIVDIPAERIAPGRMLQRRNGSILLPARGAELVPLFAHTPIAVSVAPDFTASPGAGAGWSAGMPAIPIRSISRPTIWSPSCCSRAGCARATTSTGSARRLCAASCPTRRSSATWTPPPRGSPMQSSARRAVTIFGDYDVDGATSAALLVRLLRDLGLPRAYIPDRLMEGYGPSGEALVKIGEAGSKPDRHRRLRRAGVRGARRWPSGAGVDVIVVDHHKCAADAPRCLALVNPNRLDEARRRGARPSRRGRRRLPARRRAAPHAARARLLRHAPNEPALIDLLDLVALGTVADVARLKGSTARSSRRG